MKTMTVLTALFALSAVASAGEGWETDFAAASAKAKEEGKYMLLDFSGSDWCGWCVRLDREVFQKDEFKKYAADNLVPVLLDFPRRKKLDAALVTQNRGLAQKYGVRGYPTIIVLGPEGDLVGRTGYRPGGPEAYVTHLKSLVDPHKVKSAPAEDKADEKAEEAAPAEPVAP